MRTLAMVFSNWSSNKQYTLVRSFAYVHTSCPLLNLTVGDIKLPVFKVSARVLCTGTLHGFSSSSASQVINDSVTISANHSFIQLFSKHA